VPRIRSVAAVVLLWIAAFAGSSAPDGFGGPRHAEMPLVAGTVARPAYADATPDRFCKGKRWALLADPDGKRWDLPEDRVGRRWS
jgi:hypothetical protein